MDVEENELFAKLRSDLVICQHERKTLSEKLDCLIELLRRAWHGKRDSIQKISEILDLPAPRIIPCEKDISENERLSHEYLQITSSLLDDQLKEDFKVKRKMRGLQSSSANKKKSPPRIGLHSASTYTQQSRISQFIHPFQVLESNSSSTPKSMQFECPVSNNENNFSTKVESVSSASSHSRAPHSDLSNFSHMNVAQRTRPLSAALQRRQDYLRYQKSGKQQRPQSAKPAFHFTELESLDHFNSFRHDDNGYVQSQTSMIMNEDPAHAISVDIYTKSSGRNIITENRNVFPEERDVESLGDVAEALRRVQRMQTIFRRNTKRLQQRIGIPEAGCI